MVILKACGTERALPRVQPVDASEVLPHFGRLPSKAKVAPAARRPPPAPARQAEEAWPDDISDSDQDTGADDEHLDFSASLVVDGPLHMVETVTLDLSRSMHHFDEVATGMTHLCRMCRWTDSRSRML